MLRARQRSSKYQFYSLWFVTLLLNIIHSNIETNTYCIVFMFCFSSSCVTYVGSFSGLYFFLFASSVISNIYPIKSKNFDNCSSNYKTSLIIKNNPTIFYLLKYLKCSKPGKWTVVYVCVRGIYQARKVNSRVFVC